MSHFVWLASASPRRAQLLDQIGVAHRPLVADDDEDAEALEIVQRGDTPESYVARVARLKLSAAIERRLRRGLDAAPVLVADTTVAVGRRILGKPQDAQEALAMLDRLSGRTHRVCTAIAVASANGRRRHAALSVTRVTVDVLPLVWRRAYVASGEPFGKAGGYAIQGRFATRVMHLAGSFSGVMGLPLHETGALLRTVGVRCGDTAPDSRRSPVARGGRRALA